MRGKLASNSLDVLYIELTNSCNLRCVHCGNDGKRLNLGLKELESILNDFNAVDGKKLILTGGEPLVHPSIQEVLDLSSSHVYNTKLSTNGLLLNSPGFSFVFNYEKLGFRVSLDGTREVHNKIRRNSRAYDGLISAMKKISRYERQLIVRTTVMQENKKCISEMLHELDRMSKEEGLKIYSINIWPIRNIGGADPKQLLSSEEYRAFLENLNESTRDLAPDFRIIVGPTFGLEKKFSGGPIQDNEIYGCDILNTSLHIAASGDIYPCSFVHYPLGNIRDMKIYEVFRSPQAIKFRKQFLDRNNHDCGGCDSYQTCRAGCIAERFSGILAGVKTRDVYCFKILEGKCTGT